MLTWLLIGYTANQEPADLLTQLLTKTTTHKFPSLFVGEKVLVGPGKGHVKAEQHLAGGQDSFPVARVEGVVKRQLGDPARVGADPQPGAGNF